EPSWAPTRRRARSTAICRAGTCRTSSSWAQAPFRRTPATTRRARSRRSHTGRRKRSERNISRVPVRSCTREDMFRRGRKVLLAIALLAVSLSACTHAHGDGYGDQQNFDLIQRGRYLVTLGDCTECHSDPTRTDSPFGGGHPVPTPLGTLVAPNITPDLETGIGNWSAQQFDDAVRRGRMPNGKRLYPAMPYPYFARMSAADVRAMRAYLNTVAPVHHAVTSDTLPFPLSIRASMVF